MNEEVLVSALIEGVSKGNQDLFRQLYEETNKRLFQYLYRMTGDRETAEDLMVDTYAEIWKSARRFEGRSKVMTWIVGIARNLALNEFRKRKADCGELTEEAEAVPADQHQNCASSETSEILAKALNRLPVGHREVVDLVFLQEMKYEDISEVLDIPVNTVKTRIFYAKDRLREILRQMGVHRDDLI